LTDFAQRIQSAAAQRQEYISANTWNLLPSRQNALVQGAYERAKKISSIIKQEVRKDKEEHLRKELEELEGNARSWTGLKRLRNRPRLKFTKFNDKDGGRIPRSQYPHKAAEYLSITGAVETKPRKLAKTKAQPRMFDKRGIPNQ
jgi:hypothetical protein